MCIIPSTSEFCSQERWALADGDVGVEEAWYFLSSYSCKQECSSPSLTWPCSRSSKLGDAEERQQEHPCSVGDEKCLVGGGLAKHNGTSTGAAIERDSVQDVASPVPGSGHDSRPPILAKCGTSVQDPSVAFLFS